MVATTPINVFLPFFGQLECLNAGKLIGASTLDTVRANDLLAKQLRLDPRSVVLPVVGGCSPLTRVPLFSHAYPASSVSNMSAVSTFVVISVFYFLVLLLYGVLRSSKNMNSQMTFVDLKGDRLSRK